MSTNDVPLLDKDDATRLWHIWLYRDGVSQKLQAIATERARVCAVRPMDEWTRLFVQVTGASHGVGAFLDMAQHLNLIAEHDDGHN